MFGQQANLWPSSEDSRPQDDVTPAAIGSPQLVEVTQPDELGQVTLRGYACLELGLGSETICDALREYLCPSITSSQ